MTMTGFATDHDAIARHALNTPFVYLTYAEASAMACEWVTSDDRERGLFPWLTLLCDEEEVHRGAVLTDLDTLAEQGHGSPQLEALRAWALMDPDEVLEVMFSYSLDGNIYTGMDEESDADECTVFYADSTRLVSVVRAARGGWRLASSPSDYLSWPVSVQERRRYATVNDAVADACKRGGALVRVVSDWSVTL